MAKKDFWDSTLGQALDAGLKAFVGTLTRGDVEKMRQAARETAERMKHETGGETPIQKDPYGVLGVSQDAPDEVINAAYKALIKKYHPDRKGGDEQKARELNNAYSEIKKQRGLL